MDPPLELLCPSPTPPPQWAPVASLVLPPASGPPAPPAGAAAAAAAPLPAAAAAAAQATATSILPPTAKLAGAIRQSVLPCQACRTLRTKCVGGFPCNRCFDLGHTCVPGSAIGVTGKGGRKRPSDDGASATGMQSPAPMDLAYLSSDPLPVAEVYARACVRVFEEGRCSRASILRFLRKWRRDSLRMGADVTVGVAKVLQERAGIDPMELVDRDELLHGPTDAARRVRLVAEQMEQDKRARELLEWDAFKRAEMGGAAVYSIRVDEQGRYVGLANAAFQRLMGGAGWPGRHMQAYRMLPPYLGAFICAPVDRQVLLQAIADNFLEDMADTRRATHVFKFFLGDGSGSGRVGLVIMTLERITLEDGSVGLTTRMEPAPPSRHLTLQALCSESSASFRQRSATRRHKKGYRQSTLADAAAAAAVAGAATAAGPGAGTLAAGQAQQAQGPGAFAFPSVAVVPGVALPAGGGVFLDAAAEALFARRAPQEEKEQAAAAGALPSIEPGARRRTRKRRAAAGAGGGNDAGGDSSEAGTGDRAQELGFQPFVSLATADKGGGGGSALLYDGAFPLDTDDWQELFDEDFVRECDALGFKLGGSPIAMEDVFKGGV